MEEPTVSVVCITFNHAPFIAQALQGFLDQRTEFPVEIIVADDASTDDTAERVRQFAGRHPERIRPVLRSENVGIGPNLVDALSRARGRYVALCEGDDYWTDPEKLALQVAALDADPAAMLAFHRAEVRFEDGPESAYTLPPADWQPDLTRNALVTRNVIATSSVLYRRIDYSNVPVDILPLDWYLHLLHATRGPVVFLDRTMSVYRRHSGGIWRDVEESSRAFWERHGLAQLAMYEAIMGLVGDDPPCRELVLQHTRGTIAKFCSTSDALPNPLTEAAVRKFPSFFEDFARFYFVHWTLTTQREAACGAANQALRAELVEMRRLLTTTREKHAFTRAQLTNSREGLKAARRELVEVKARQPAERVRRSLKGLKKLMRTLGGSAPQDATATRPPDVPTPPVDAGNPSS